jgi:hypothetical protein
MNNLQDIHHLQGELRISVKEVRLLWQKLCDDTPEDCFLQDIVDDLSPQEPPGTLITLDTLAWFGDFSGERYHNLLIVLGRTTGKAQFGLVWENGELSGLDVRDGAVAEHEANIALGARKQEVWR